MVAITLENSEPVLLLHHANQSTIVKGKYSSRTLNCMQLLMKLHMYVNMETPIVTPEHTTEPKPKAIMILPLYICTAL